jgi:hypothetical protein
MANHPNRASRKRQAKLAAQRAQLPLASQPQETIQQINAPALLADTPDPKPEVNGKSKTESSPFDRGGIISGLIGIGIGLISNSAATDPHIGYVALPFLWIGIGFFAWPKRRRGRLFGILACVISLCGIQKLVQHKVKLSNDADREQKITADKLDRLEKAATNHPPEFIEGTDVPRAFLRHFFPYGYAVFIWRITK